MSQPSRKLDQVQKYKFLTDSSLTLLSKSDDHFVCLTLRVLRELNEIGLGPPVVASFRNGLIFKHLPGSVLTEGDSKSPGVIRFL